MRQSPRTLAATKTWRAVGALLVALVMWQAWIGSESREAAETAATSIPAAGGTPAMAASPVASPVASPMPPAAMGQPAPYGDDWVITATGVSLMPEVRPWTAKGIFAAVALTIENRGAAPRDFPFDDLRLEAAGSLYAPDLGASNWVGTGYFRDFPPADPLETAVVFDIPAAAAGPFILQSVSNPNFRVLVQQERRG